MRRKINNGTITIIAITALLVTTVLVFSTISPVYAPPPNQQLFVSTFSTGTVAKIDLNTFSSPSTIRTGLTAPEDGAVHPISGKVYFAEPGAGKIKRFNQDGTNVEIVLSSATTFKPEGLSFNAAGDLFFNQRAGGTGAIYRISGGAVGVTPVQVTVSFTSFGEGSLIDSNGNLWGIDSVADRIINFGTSFSPLPSGTVIHDDESLFGTPTPPGGKFVGISEDSSGRIYVSHSSGSIFSFDPDGSNDVTYKSGLGNIFFTEFDSQDNLYVARFLSTSAVHKIAPGGGVPITGGTLTTLALAGGAVGLAISSPLDITPPVISLTSITPASPAVVPIGDPITLTVDGGETGLSVVTATINGVDVSGSVSPSGNSYAFTYNVAEGDGDSADSAALPVSIILEDAAGNDSNEIDSAVGEEVTAANSPGVDATAPTAPGTPSGDTLVNIAENNAGEDYTVSMGSSGAVAGDTVRLFVDAVEVDSATVPNPPADVILNTGASAFSGTSGSVTARIDDISGNPGALSTGLSVTVDLVAPTAPGTPSGDTLVNIAENNAGEDYTVSMGSSGAVAGDTVRLFVDAVEVDSATVPNPPADVILNTGASAFSGTSGSVTARIDDISGNPGALSTGLSVTVDLVVPTADNVTSLKANGFYTIGEQIVIDVDWSEQVKVSTGGTPTISLNSGGTATFSGTLNTLASSTPFDYTVLATQNAADLETGTTITLAAGDSIQDAAGNDANLALPAGGGPVDSLGDNKNIQIDTTDPTMTAPPDVRVESDGGTTVELESGGVHTATDNLTPTADIVVTNNQPTPDDLNTGTFADGKTSVTWTAEDLAGNTNTDDQLVTVSEVFLTTVTIDGTDSAAAGTALDPHDAKWDKLVQLSGTTFGFNLPAESIKVNWGDGTTIDSETITDTSGGGIAGTSGTWSASHRYNSDQSGNQRTITLSLSNPTVFATTSTIVSVNAHDTELLLQNTLPLPDVVWDDQISLTIKLNDKDKAALDTDTGNMDTAVKKLRVTGAAIATPPDIAAPQDFNTDLLDAGITKSMVTTTTSVQSAGHGNSGTHTNGIQMNALLDDEVVMGTDADPRYNSPTQITANQNLLQHNTLLTLLTTPNTPLPNQDWDDTLVLNVQLKDTDKKTPDTGNFDVAGQEKQIRVDGTAIAALTVVNTNISTAASSETVNTGNQNFVLAGHGNSGFQDDGVQINSFLDDEAMAGVDDDTEYISPAEIVFDITLDQHNTELAIVSTDPTSLTAAPGTKWDFPFGMRLKLIDIDTKTPNTGNFGVAGQEKTISVSGTGVATTLSVPTQDYDTDTSTVGLVSGNQVVDTGATLEVVQARGAGATQLHPTPTGVLIDAFLDDELGGAGTDTDTQYISPAQIFTGILIDAHSTSLAINELDDIVEGTTFTAVSASLTDDDRRLLANKIVQFDTGSLENLKITYQDTTPTPPPPGTVGSSLGVGPSLIDTPPAPTLTSGLTITDSAGTIVLCSSSDCPPAAEQVLSLTQAGTMDFPTGTVVATLLFGGLESFDEVTFRATDVNGIDAPDVTVQGVPGPDDPFIQFTGPAEIASVEVIGFSTTGAQTPNTAVLIRKVVITDPEADPSIIFQEDFENEPLGTFQGPVAGVLKLQQGAFHTSARADPSDNHEFELKLKAKFDPTLTPTLDYDLSLSNEVGYFTIEDTAPGIGGSGTSITPDSGVGFLSIACGFDGDGDSLCNGWEANLGAGIPFKNGVNADVFLPLAGSNSAVPDIFLEIDCMTGHCPDFTTGIQPVINMFTSSPGGPRTLHVTIDDQNLPHVPGAGGTTWSAWRDSNTNHEDDFSSIKARFFGKSTERSVISTTQTNGVSNPTATTKTTTVSAITLSTPPFSADYPDAQTKGLITIKQRVTGNAAWDVTATPALSFSGTMFGNLILQTAFASVQVFPPGLTGDKIFTYSIPFRTTAAVSPAANFGTITASFSTTSSVTLSTPTTESGSPSVQTRHIEAKAQVYHYALFVHSIGSCGPSGLAEVLGNDIIVALGCDFDTDFPELDSMNNPLGNDANGKPQTRGSGNEISGTLAHELGHNLALKHGGPDTLIGTSPFTFKPGDSNINCKPMYRSVMNYAYQTGSFTGGNLLLDYSRGFYTSGTDYDENALNEAAGLHGAPFLHPDVVYGVPGATPSVWPGVTVSSLAPDLAINWDGDLTPNEASVIADITDFGITGCSSSPGQKLNDYIDWFHINPNFRGSGGQAFDGVRGDAKKTPEVNPVVIDEIELASDQYSGTLVPVNPDGSSIYKIGRTVPFKIQIKDADGNFIQNAQISLLFAKISDVVSGTVAESPSIAEANDEGLFRYNAEAEKYIYNWKSSAIRSLIPNPNDRQGDYAFFFVKDLAVDMSGNVVGGQLLVDLDNAFVVGAPGVGDPLSPLAGSTFTIKVSFTGK